jgi:hypothetical protein
VLIYGRWGRASNRAFLAAGLMFIVLGAGIAIAG